MIAFEGERSGGKGEKGAPITGGVALTKAAERFGLESTFQPRRRPRKHG